MVIPRMTNLQAVAYLALAAAAALMTRLFSPPQAGPDWNQLMDRYGLPLVLLVALVWALWQIGKKAGPELVGYFKRMEQKNDAMVQQFTSAFSTTAKTMVRAQEKRDRDFLTAQTKRDEAQDRRDREFLGALKDLRADFNTGIGLLRSDIETLKNGQNEIARKLDEKK